MLSTSPALQIGGAHGLDLHRAFDGRLEQLLQAVLTQQAPKAPDLGRVARQAGLVVVHAAEELPLHVLGPTLDQLIVAEVEAALKVQQADHQADGQPWAAGRADAAAELAVECADQIFADYTLGRLCLVGQLRCHRRFDGGPRQPCGQHRQQMPQIDHLVQPRAKEVRRAHPHIPQNSGHWNIVLRGSQEQDSNRKVSAQAARRCFAGPTQYEVQLPGAALFSHSRPIAVDRERQLSGTSARTPASPPAGRTH